MRKFRSYILVWYAVLAVAVTGLLGFGFAGTALAEEHTAALLHLDNDTYDASDPASDVDDYGSIAFSDTTKKFGSHAISLNGTDAVFTVAPDPSIVVSEDDFTVDFWFNIPEFSTENPDYLYALRSDNLDQMMFSHGSHAPDIRAAPIIGSTSGAEAYVSRCNEDLSGDLCDDDGGWYLQTGLLQLYDRAGTFLDTEVLKQDQGESLLTTLGRVYGGTYEDRADWLYISVYKGTIYLQILYRISYFGIIYTYVVNISSSAGAVSTGTWHHVELDADYNASTKETTLYFFLDGTLLGSDTVSQCEMPWANLSNDTHYFGGGSGECKDCEGYSPLYYTAGYFDEVRISNTVRHTTSFSVPTEAYSVDGCGNGYCTTGECADGCTDDCSSEDCCGNGDCDTAMGETCDTCEADCGDCCGNGICEAEYGETCSTCPADCGLCCGNGVCGEDECASGCDADCDVEDCCGNGTCDIGVGETCSSCPADCGMCCGNGVCDSGECVTGCVTDCDVADCCGNGTCDTIIGEDCGNCSDDCGVCITCGDGICQTGECHAGCSADCSVEDCCGNGTCDAGIGETCDTCSDDCGECCGNGVCDLAYGECADGCLADCSVIDCCGNGACDTGIGETAANCEEDCGAYSGSGEPTGSGFSGGGFGMN